ncbi:MAG: precorrin-6y C5,15-methyltransferase (decarboxylating) subunit CbiE [Oscillospiraceae bacterium]
MVEKMKVYIVGTGMEGRKTLTAEAKTIIENAEVLIGARRMVEPFMGMDKQFFISWKSEEIADYLCGKSFTSAVILVSGDCGFYSGAEKLVQLISNIDTEIICGISSPVYFCSKIKKPCQDMKFISLHGTDGNIVRNVRRNELCFFLLGGNITPAHICRKLCEYGMSGVKIYIGENLGYENERILQGTAVELTELEFGTLTVAVAENSEYEHGTVLGIPDENFIRGIVPMTKSEVRSTVISKLNISRNDICWDIGCGTGSVSVEMALQCFDGKVYSVDKNEEAVGLTRENALKFGCDNIEIISGSAPNVLSALPSPDRVFVGGSQGRINEIFEIVFGKNLYAQIVVTAVSLETLNSAVAAFEKHGISCPDIVQLAVTRTKKVGAHTMLSAENPVFIIKGAKL